MYLKSIKLDGFKSFANKTTFELNKGITAIVGPNGSGKSNIVDAVKWTLGSQSLKSLRGGSHMSDVIFGGSEMKDALNKASVTLTFDNKDKFLNSEYSEIEVKRVIYKTGESEYLINNNKVRLKDIEELFIDFFSSNDSLNIISQNSVQDIVNSKPYERRTIFESAAGVLKYKRRKEESLRKLDKTKDNLEAVNLVINELDLTVTPLKKEAEIATKYVDLKNELESNEISLTAFDITNLSNELKMLENKEVELKDKLDKMTNISNTEEIDKIKLDIYKLDDEISLKNKELISLTEEISNVSSEKRIQIERQKFEYSDDKAKTNLINLKEEEASLIKDINVLNNEIDKLNEKIKDLSNKLNNDNNMYKATISKKELFDIEINRLNKEKLEIENKIDILESNILNNERIPKSVSNILNNPRLKGIHNTISNLIDIKDEYLTALDVSLSSASNFIVVDNELSAKNAINYLKDNKLGRATFLPLNIIKSRYIKNDIKDILNKDDYIGILSDLVNYDQEYDNIIKNQLGNIIVAKDIDSMNKIAKLINYKYRVVSLDGSIYYAGGSISGGTNNKSNTINLKLDLEKYKNSLIDINNNIDKKIREYKNILEDENKYNDIITNKTQEYLNMTTIKDSKLKVLDEYEERLKIIKSEIDGVNNIKDNSFEKTLDNLINKLNVLQIEKEKLELNINNLKFEKDNLSQELSNVEKKINNANSEYKVISNELSEVQISIGKISVKLDNLLLYLNEEYNMTYEYAKENYDLSFDVNLVRNKVKKLKSEIRSLGDVNTGSIAEYKRLSERYEFLVNQRNDLEISMHNLLNIISDMDNIMKDKFANTFNKIANEFTNIFKLMFQGGTGKLVLTDPDDYLNTGIDMIVSPKGKKINNISALSGGEKSLTAICLLFSILNVSPSPFIILDEVEAALDESNVDLFGEFLNSKKDDNQYILITHKKRMMEYADTLYGITMQMPGISKVVGVKLEEI